VTERRVHRPDTAIDGTLEADKEHCNILMHMSQS